MRHRTRVPDGGSTPAASPTATPDAGWSVDPAALLERHGLPSAGHEPLASGSVNRVWRTRQHVLRLACLADHACEARLAAAARSAGIATPAPVAHGPGYGIWQRWPGRRACELATVPVPAGQALPSDLDTLHRHPPEPPLAPPERWQGRLASIAGTQARARWSPGERRALRRLLGAEHELRHRPFVHGDAFGDNVLVDAGGACLGVIDWGCAGWSSLEAEAARLEDGARALALERWRERLDPKLLWAMRLDLLLEVARRGRAGFGRVRQALDRADAAPG